MIYNGSTSGLDDLQATVDQTVMDLRLHADEFDFIAVRGCSGMLVGAPVSLALDKPLVVIRKPGENAHGLGTIVNRKHCKGRYVFLDDFVSSGSTRRAVFDGIFAAGCEGVCTYVATYGYAKNFSDAGWNDREYPFSSYKADREREAAWADDCVDEYAAA